MAALGLLPVLLACGDSTGPERTLSGALNVALTASVRDGYSVEWQEEDLIISCTVDLKAVITGRGSASWRDMVLRFYIGPGGTTFVDSVVIGAADVTESWNSASLSPGVTAESQWRFSAYVPFSASLEYRYKSTDTPERAVSASFTCGPPSSPTAAPPAITQLALSPPAGELEAGTPASVQFEISAPAGLWRTDVHIDGPCFPHQVLAGGFVTGTTRTISVPLPRECTLGEPLVARVVATDAAARSVTRVLQTSVVIADHVAPILAPFFYIPPYRTRHHRLAGSFFTEDAIPTDVVTIDHHRVASVHWEVLPYEVRDSVIASGMVNPWVPAIPLRPEWSGPIRVRIWARDVAGNTSDTVTSGADSAFVYPYRAVPVRTVSIPGGAGPFAIDGDGGVVHVATRSRSLVVVSLSSATVLQSIALPADVMDLDVTASGDSVIVVYASRREIGVVDLTGSAPQVTGLPLDWLDATEWPARVRIGSDGKAYLTLAMIRGTVQELQRLDLATGSGTPVTGAGAGGTGGTGWGRLERSDDHAVLLLHAVDPTCTQRYRVGAGVFEPCVQPSPSYGFDADGDGDRFVIGTTWYDAAGTPAPRSPAALDLSHSVIAISPDGDDVYVWLGYGGLVRARPDGRIMEKLVRTASYDVMRTTPDGTTLVAVKYGDWLESPGAVHLIDIR